jgi:5S rRNA maturation endonuclease (ribonuclease M5)
LFELVKSKVNLLETIEKDLQVTFKESGEHTYSIEDEKQYGGCPFCTHNDCFKIKQDPAELIKAIYHCFSCEAHGSVIDWVAHQHNLSVVDAARKLAKDNGIPLPKDYSPVQELFNIAAGYYHKGFNEICNKPQMKLAKMTPIDFQLKVRGHKPATLSHFQIGWSDGGLIEFLESLGYEEELLLETGLKSKKTGKDFLPANCFIYPHFIKGRVSHFTFKDPVKKLAYQLPNKFVLNGAEFYNQDSVKDFDTIIIVEGENDLLSVFENTVKYGVIGTIGQISGSQLDWIREKLAGKNVITIFDPDDAGNKYRSKVEKIKGAFKSLLQITPTEDKDIDEHLTSGTDLDKLIDAQKSQTAISKTYTPPEGLNSQTGVENKSISNVESVEVDENSTDNSFFEKHGCYYKVKYKDGEPIYTKVSNFTLQLRNVYATEEGDRLREIIVIREDGYTSDPVLATSEVKVSLKSFRTLLARAADADFTGTEHDLIAMWALVYSKSTETLVKVTRVIGRHEKSRGWIFRNKFISDAGWEADPDESGIFWLNGRAIGIRPESLNKGGHGNETADIPYLYTDNSSEEREELLKGLCHNLAKNLGDVGSALIMIAWMNACAYSNSIFQLNYSFPFLFVWGSNGEGKGTICSWLMDIYDLGITGHITVSQIKSGVGLGRKAEYYASLPLWIDEIRADQDTREFASTFRSYFDRTARTMGAKDGFGVKVQEVRSCFMYAGEDHFEDPATKERCVTVRVARLNREKVESFQWIDSKKGLLSSIGYKWIHESVNEDHKKLKAEIKQLDRELIVEAKCSSRKSKLWAVVGVFALRLADKFFPDFDMKKHLFETSTSDSNAQKSETTVAQFFETVESVISQDGIAKLNTGHIQREGNLLHIWFPHVYRVVNETYHGKFAFSKNAILAQLKEEPYFVSDLRKISMGINGVRRVVITLDLDKATDCIKNIGQFNE